MKQLKLKQINIFSYLSLGKHLLFLLLAMAVIYFCFSFYGEYLSKFPLSVVEVHGNLYYTPQHDIKQAVLTEPRLGFFSLKLDPLQNKLLNMPWISNVNIRRVWPNQIQIWLEEEVPLARWGDTGVMNTRGDIFYPHQRQNLAWLPIFIADRKDKDTVVERYFNFLKQLKPVGLSITSIEVMTDHGFKLSLDNGVELILGRDDHAARLRRFIQAYRFQLINKISEIAYIDLRYTNGIAIGWRSVLSGKT